MFRYGGIELTLPDGSIESYENDWGNRYDYMQFKAEEGASGSLRILKHDRTVKYYLPGTWLEVRHLEYTRTDEQDAIDHEAAERFCEEHGL